MKCNKLSNVHTVQEAAEMFANASTDSKSPEQLCLLSFLSTSAYHSGHACPPHTLRHTLLPQHFSKVYKTVKQHRSPPHAEVQEHHQTFLSVTAPKSTHTHPCNQIHFTGLQFKNTFKSQICHMCVFWMEAKVRKHAQTGPKRLGLCEYLCEYVSFLGRKNINFP